MVVNWLFMSPSPEEKARQTIDSLLTAAGWIVQDRVDANIDAGRGVAIREFSLGHGFGEADYLLFADGQAVGVVEAKAEGHTLTGVEIQTQKYSEGIPASVPAPCRPLPFCYQSTAVETRFTNLLEPEAASRPVFCFHTPATLAEWVRDEVAAPGSTPRARLAHMPPLIETGLRPAQIEAVHALEDSMRHGRRRALIQMATGAGKTYTACNFLYRLIKFAGARRVLFLVDRANLGRQALKEFQAFRTPDDGRIFTELYNVQRLQSNRIDPVAKVCIATIQRLFSMLKGEELDPDLDEQSGASLEMLQRQPEPIAYEVDEWKSTDLKPEDMLNQFRTGYNPRIAVTVDMIATGTDIKPLEIVMFMRAVKSRTMFEQMKGRGARTVTSTELRDVTPDGYVKDHFVLIDAVGLKPEEMAETQPLERIRNVSLDKLFELVAFGNRDAEVLSSIAARLTRLDRQLTPNDRTAVTDTANGQPLSAIAGQIVSALDPDRQIEAARALSGGKGWELLQPVLYGLIQQRNSTLETAHREREREAARLLAENLEGIGPKQARNLLQSLGLTRFEIPLDSRVAGWLAGRLGWNIRIEALADRDYYEDLLDRVQASCERAGVLPTVFDAAVFEEMGKEVSVKAKPSTCIGYVNRNGQVVVRNTMLPGTDKNQYVYQLACSQCGFVYGANGSDIHERKCPKCQGGIEGLQIECELEGPR